MYEISKITFNGTLRFFKHLLFHLMAFFFSSCMSKSELPQKLDNTQKQPSIIFHSENKPERSFFVEIADSPEEQAQGLMYRTSLPLNHGMLFIFPDERQLSFWMKNTFIPLDMIFMNRNFEVITIVKQAIPKTETPLRSVFPAKYVLEISGGLTDQYHIVPGERAIFKNSKKNSVP